MLDECELIDPADVLRRMRADFVGEPHIKLWCYTVEPKFFAQNFLAGRDGARTDIIMDYRQRDRLQHYLSTEPGLSLRVWQRNRTQHDKSLICATKRIAWITTSNLHRGSFLLANNSAMRIARHTIVDAIDARFDHGWRLSTPIEKLTGENR